jgi:hypothetical protein
MAGERRGHQSSLKPTSTVSKASSTRIASTSAVGGDPVARSATSLCAPRHSIPRCWLALRVGDRVRPRVEVPPPTPQPVVARHVTSDQLGEVLDQPVDDCVPRVTLGPRHAVRERVRVRNAPDQVLGCNVCPAVSLREGVVNPNAAIEMVGDHERDAAAPLQSVGDPLGVVCGWRRRASLEGNWHRSMVARSAAHQPRLPSSISWTGTSEGSVRFRGRVERVLHLR